VIKGLGRLGFKIENQEGSHVKVALGARKVTVPKYKALLPKTLKSILNQADITIEELLGVL
jgi:predicted RNA binding protein YcfA (HicA-like mRNA interferase family)